MNRVLIIPLLILLYSTTAIAIEIESSINGSPPTPNPAYRVETGTQMGRISRVGAAGTCAAPKANPGAFDAVDRQYDEYTFIALEAGCVSVSLTGGDNQIHSLAYNSNGLAVGDVDSAYLADAGSSPTSGNPTTTYSFNVQKGEEFSVVVHEVTAGTGTGVVYTLDVSGVRIEPEFSITETLDVTAPQTSFAFQTSVTGNQTGRLNRNAIKSSCEVPKSNPGLFSTTGDRRRDFFRIVPHTSGCLQVTLSHVGSGQIHLVAYDQNGFNPTAPADNYIADTGLSSVNDVQHMSFLVQAGVPFDLVVFEVNSASSIGDEYTLNLTGVRIASSVEINGKLDVIGPANTPDFTPATTTQGDRLTRNGIVSTCDAPKANPGLQNAAGARRVDTYEFVPTGSGCVQVTFQTIQGTPENYFSVAYNQNGLNAPDPSLNYIADAGSSISDPGQSRSYSFNVTAGVPFTVAVHETDPGGSPNGIYRLWVEGVPLTAVNRAKAFDFDGDERTDASVFRPGPGEWWYLRSSDNDNRAFQFGQTTDIITPADFTGDGVTDVAFFRPSTGFWFVLKSEDSTFFAFPLGNSTDIPAPGDFDNDGIADPTVYRPSEGNWYIRRSSDSVTTITPFGIAEDKPVVGDYDGDGAADIAVFRPSLSQWWIQRSNEGLIAFQFGAPGDIPTPADFTGDGRTDVAFFRPSNEWFVLRSEDEQFFSFPFGTGGDIPVPGDYDADGVADAAVYRPSVQTWFALRSTENVQFTPFGAPGDIPAPSAYQP